MSSLNPSVIPANAGIHPIIKIVVLTLAVVGLIAGMFGLTIAQEIPTGTVSGLVLNQAGEPAARARVTLRMYDDYEAPTIRGTTDQQGHYVITDIPVGKWTGHASARGYESANLEGYESFQVVEGKTTAIKDVEMVPRPPSLYGGFPSVFMPDEKRKVSIDGYSGKETTQLKISIYRFDFAADIRGRWGKSGGSRPEVSARNLHDPIYQHTYDVRTDSEGYFSKELTLPLNGEGGYAVRAQLETAEAFYTTQVTDLALVTKRAPGQLLVYASSYTKKRPLPGVKLEFFGQDNKRRPSGVTDANGVFVLPENSTDPIGVLGCIDKSCAFAHTYGYSQDDRGKCLIYTDRPVYRPGHTVMFKGILAKSDPGSLVPLVGKAVAIKITDSEGSTLKEFKVTTSRFGTFNGKFDIDPEAKPGYYGIHASVDGEEHERSFSVEEYRKPEFKASVSFSKPRFVGGETVEANVNAVYYFGGPVAGAKVTYTVYKSPSYFYYYPDDIADAQFYEDLYSASESDSEYEGDYYHGAQYGEVVQEGEGVTDATGVLKIRVPTKSLLSTESYSVSASVMDASGRTVDASGDAMITPGDFLFSVDTGNYFYQPNTPVDVRIYAVNYDRKPVADVSATLSLYKLDDVKRDKKTLITTRAVQLDASGRGSASLKPTDEGEYDIEVTAKDQSGHTIQESHYVYVASENYSGEGYEPPALQLTVDKKIYKTGDTARVMIASPLKESYVLLTIEGRRLFKHQVVHMTSPTKVIEVPLLNEYAPNVYASACLVDGKEMSTSEKPIPISPKGKFVNVRIETNKKRYLPGEQATYKITTTDENGRGVPAEVSLGVVDESIYAIREDSTPDIRRFFHGPVRNYVSTSFSYRDYYYGGEDKFSGKVRKYFPDTAYWNPSIVTDQNGVASVSFKMPDNLTQWRATARAVTANMAVGSAKQFVTVTKNILVRLQMPRFFRQRDQFTLTAVVHNYTERDQNVKVWLEVQGLTVSGDLSRNVNVTSNGAAVVSWDAKAENTGKAVLTVYAKGQTDQDAVRLEAPILAHGVAENVSVADVTKTSTGFALNLPGGILRDASVLRMGFSSSLASAGLGMVDAIEDYRMESPEGIMDVLLPNVVMYEAMQHLGNKSPVRLGKIRKLVQHDLKRVYQWQLPDGSWSWWEQGQNDPWMTAYVVYGLVRAKQSGLPVNEIALKRGIESAIRSLPNVYDLGKRATIVYVLALAGEAKLEWVDPILADKKLQNYSLSLMILSLVEMGQVDRARALVPKLINGASQSSKFCSWPESFQWGFYSCNDYETTAYAIRALLAVDPENPCIDKGIRWLLTKRKGDRWNMNYDTASVVYALADYLRIRRAETPSYSAGVFVNNRLVREFTMDAKSITEPEIKITLTGANIQPGRNMVRIEKNGPGDLFYWANLTYYSSAEDVPAKSSGKISIKRQYYRLLLVKDQTRGLVYKSFPLGDTATVGELIRCHLTIVAPKNFQYMIVEDMLPSGCEVVERYNKPQDYEEGEGGEAIDFWWGGQTIYDNRVSFYLPYVYNGKRVIEYDFRPEIRGTFHVMPAVAQGSFEPDIYAHSDERRLIVK